MSSIKNLCLGLEHIKVYIRSTCEFFYTRDPHECCLNLVDPLNKSITELPCDPPITFLDIYSQELGTSNQTNTWTQILIDTLIIIAKMWKQAKYPSSDGFILIYVLYSYNGILALKKN